MPGNKGLLKNSTALQPQIGLPKILSYSSGLPLAGPSLVNYFCATSMSGLYQCQLVNGRAAWVPVTSGSTGGGGGGGSIVGSGLSGSIALWVSNSGLGNSLINQPGLSINVTAASGSPATSGTPATSAGIVFLQGGTGGAGFSVNPPTPGGPVYIQGGTGGNGSGTIPGSGGTVYILGGIPGLSGTFNAGTAGNVNILGGMASGNPGFQGGSVLIDAGFGVSENGQIYIGTNNAQEITLGNFASGNYQTINNSQIEISHTSEVYIYGGGSGIVELNAGTLNLIANYQFELLGTSGSSVGTTTGPLLIEGGGSVLLTSSSGQGSSQSGVSIVGGLGNGAISGFIGGGTAGGVFIQAGGGAQGANSGYLASSGAPVYIQAGQGGTGGTSGQAIQAGGGTVYVFGGAGGTQLSGHPSSGGAGGNVIIDAGVATGSGSPGFINIGTSNAISITLGQSGIGLSIEPAGGVTVAEGAWQFQQPISTLYGGTGTSNFQAGAVLVGGSPITTYSGTANQLLTMGGSGYNLVQISGGVPGQQLTYVSGGLPSWSNFTGGFAPGTILMYGAPTAPPGWLNCDGTSYAQNTYAALYNVIGSTYGSIASGFFNVPDMRGRVAVGTGTGTGATVSGTGLISGGTALTARAMGAWLGEETHTLSAGEMPNHTHSYGYGGAGANINGTGASLALGSPGTAAWVTFGAGSGLAHNTMQPSNTLNYIICATAAGSSTFNASYPSRATLWADEMIATTASGLSNALNVGEPYNQIVYQTSPANGDSFTLGCFLAGGVYTFNVLGYTSASQGLIDWYIDGTKYVSAQDWYSSSTIYNIVKTTSSVSVNGNGYHVLKGVINGKNASAGGYYWALTKAWLEPVTDQTNIAPPSQIGQVNDFRLTAYSGIGVPTTDQTLVPTLYLTPKGNTSGIVNNNGAVISLLYQGSWGNYQSTSVSQSLSACTSGTAYDVYAFYSGTGVGLSATSWANQLTPPARVLQDGQLVLSGSPQYRLVGSFYCNGSGTTEDSQANRLVWSYANRRQRPVLKVDATSSWNYLSATPAQWNGNAANKVQVMVGVSEDATSLSIMGMAAPSATGSTSNPCVGIGVSQSGIVTSGVAVVNNFTADLVQAGTPFAFLDAYPSTGYTCFTMLQNGPGGTGTCTWYGSSPPPAFQTGMRGTTWC